MNVLGPLDMNEQASFDTAQNSSKKPKVVAAETEEHLWPACSFSDFRKAEPGVTFVSTWLIMVFASWVSNFWRLKLRKSLISAWSPQQCIPRVTERLKWLHRTYLVIFMELIRGLSPLWTILLCQCALLPKLPDEASPSWGAKSIQWTLIISKRIKEVHFPVVQRLPSTTQVLQQRLPPRRLAASRSFCELVSLGVRVIIYPNFCQSFPSFCISIVSSNSPKFTWMIMECIDAFRSKGADSLPSLCRRVS